MNSNILSPIRKIGFILFFASSVLLLILIAQPLFQPGIARAAVQDEIAARNKQIEELQKQIEIYQNQVNEVSGQAQTLSGEVARLSSQIKKIQLEIQSLSLTISVTNDQIGVTTQQIDDAQHKIILHQKAIGRSLATLAEIDQVNLTQVLFKNKRLSDFFTNVKDVEDTQEQLKNSIIAIKDLKADLEERQEELSEKKGELAKLKSFQESQKFTLDQNKSSKDRLLKDTKGREAEYQKLVAQKKKDVERLRAEISYLIQAGITVEDAVKYGKLAAIRAGIRPGFLLALLNMESRLGQSLGTGNWKDDMYDCYLRMASKATTASRKATLKKRAETEKAAFFAIINELGLDANTVKVSAEPNYGCGGAMGPAQFIASTWRAYESTVSQLTGHSPPNPWNIEDAFTAAAVKLARGGATSQSRAGEIAAAKAYISGSAQCTQAICNYYANTILDRSYVIEQNLSDRY